MARKERSSKGKVMTPNYFVFCEGDTEVRYVEWLRSYYKRPVHVIVKKTLLNITSSLVERCKAAYVQTSEDRTFLMYDLDVPTMLPKLKKLAGVTLLCSNPCFELWLLLHVKEQRAELGSVEVVRALVGSSPVWRGYVKSVLTVGQLAFLAERADDVIGRAKRLEEYRNPSTQVYKLLEELRVGAEGR